MEEHVNDDEQQVFMLRYAEGQGTELSKVNARTAEFTRHGAKRIFVLIFRPLATRSSNEEGITPNTTQAEKEVPFGIYSKTAPRNLYAKPAIWSFEDHAENRFAAVSNQNDVLSLPEHLRKLVNNSSNQFIVLHNTVHLNRSDNFQTTSPNWSSFQAVLEKLTKPQPNKANSPLARIQLQTAILEYSKISPHACNFSVLYDMEIDCELGKLTPVIAQHAMRLPNLLRIQIPYLRKGENQTIYLTRSLACSIVAHAMLCTNTSLFQLSHLHSDFNFFKIYHETQDPTETGVKREKIKCLLEYFRKIEQMPQFERDSIISIERRCIRAKEDWSLSGKTFCPISVTIGGGIENSTGSVQVIFADKRIGAGTLDTGCVQEAIRLCISPELLCLMLFVEELSDDEVIVVTGTKIFSSYEGYGSSFKFKPLKSFKWEESPVKDHFNRDCSIVVAMDALKLRANERILQYNVNNINRELHKSHVGFKHPSGKIPVATGNWGCGSYNGDKELKFLIQWMAASLNEVPEMKYFVNNERDSQRIKKIKDTITRNHLCVGSVYNILCRYTNHFSRIPGQIPKHSVFEYLTLEVELNPNEA